MALQASNKSIKNKHYFKTSKIGKDARFTIGKKTIGRIELISKGNGLKKSVVVRNAIDILFYKAETMNSKQFYKMVYAEFLKQSIEGAELPIRYKQKMLKSLMYLV